MFLNKFSAAAMAISTEERDFCLALNVSQQTMHPPGVGQMLDGLLRGAR